jgi:hypothetical protein
MVERDRDLNQPLQEHPFRLSGRSPDVLKHLVRVEELATIEQGNARRKSFKIHVPF